MKTVQMFRKVVVSVVSQLSESGGPKCPARILGTAPRAKVAKRRSTECSSELLMLVHTDMCDTIKRASIGGAQYLV